MTAPDCPYKRYVLAVHPKSPSRRGVPPVRPTVAETTAASVFDAAGAPRGRAEVGLFADWDFCNVGWAELNLNKSSRMLRDASQPVRSNKPTPTVCATKLLIVIPTTPEVRA